jgi:hypothetical protein
MKYSLPNIMHLVKRLPSGRTPDAVAISLATLQNYR